MPIKIDKHARQYRNREDGTRVLTTRWWPRGVHKENIDEWRTELAPSAGLLKRFKMMDQEPDLLSRERMDPAARWEWFTEQYEAEMDHGASREAILALRARHEGGAVITLLCACHRTENCHRSILARLVMGNGIPRRGGGSRRD